MEMTLPKPGRAHPGALPAHESKETTCHHSTFDVSMHDFLPILLNLLAEKASS